MRPPTFRVFQPPWVVPYLVKKAFSHFVVLFVSLRITRHNHEEVWYQCHIYKNGGWCRTWTYTRFTSLVSKTNAYTNSANHPNRLHHLVLEPFYSATSFVAFWGGGYSQPQYIKFIIIKLVARGRFELPHAWVKVMCLTAWLPGNNGGADGSRTRVQKIFTNHKSHSYLTGFVYPVRSCLFTRYTSQEQVLMLKLSTQKPIRINLFVRQSLLS